MRIRSILGLAALLAVIGVVPRAWASNPVTVLYVSTQGNDQWSGTLQGPNNAETDGPKATIDGARAALRTMLQEHQVASGGAVVYIMPGSYPLSQTVQFYAADSGSQGAPIVYKAWEPGTVEITGGKDITTWTSVSDPTVEARFSVSARSHIVQADLAALGVTDVGTRQPIGFFGARVPSVSELFFENEPMTVAQWPNGAWARTSTNAVPSGYSFTYSGGNAASWSSENDVWVHGFFYYDWADFYERVSALNPTTHAVQTQVTPSYGFQPGARFVFCNVLEELDTPGEYYLDLKRDKVYFYPPAKQSNGRTVISTLATPMIRLDSAAHIQFQDLTFRFTRDDALFINGCNDIQVEGCVVSNVGLHGIETNNVTNTVVRSCDISNVGSSGIIMSGGDRTTLTSGGNVIQNCHIATTGRIVMTSEAAIELLGDGTTVANCSIHDIPQAAIRLWGNNHVIADNEIYRTCLESSDAGAFYLGRDFTQQGNVVEKNYFHDNKCAITPNAVKGNGNDYQIEAVYLDDFTSGTTVLDNIFENDDAAVLIGGGRDNTIKSNAFLDCGYSVLMDARGLDSDSSMVTSPSSTLMEALVEVPYQSSAYKAAFPYLANILNDNPACPKRNAIENNVQYQGGWTSATNDYPLTLNPITSNSTGVNPGFVNLQALDLMPTAGSAASKVGFKAINVTSIGLKVDAFRSAVPTEGEMPTP
jgi:hypothetical protein